MQTALKNIALATALAPTGVGASIGPTNTSRDWCYVIVNDATRISLGVREPLSATVPRLTSGERSTQMSDFKGNYLKPLGQTKARGAWFDQAIARVEALRGSIAVEVEPDDRENADRSLRDAETILVKLAIAGLKKRPSIGFDSNGAVSFYVSIEGFSADFTAHGDGKCSFSAKRGELPALVEEVNIGDPLPKSLSEMLL
jgi:hypothetical protein